MEPNHQGPTNYSDIAFGNLPPPHSPWLVSTFFDVVVDSMYLEKWAVKWRDLYPGPCATHDEKHLWARKIAREPINNPSVAADHTRTHFPERALRQILYDSCAPRVRVELVASQGGGDASAIHHRFTGLGVIGRKEVLKNAESEDVIHDLLSEAGLPETTVVECPTPLDGKKASICQKIPIVVGMCAHFKDGESTVVAFQVMNYGAPPSPLESECAALKRAHSGIKLDFIRYRERLIWYSNSQEYRRVQRHIGGEGEAEHVRRAMHGGDGQARVMLCAVMTAELRYAQDEIVDPAAQVAALLALTIAARAALQRTVDTARVLSCVLAYWRDVVLIRDPNELGLGVPDLPNSGPKSRSALVEMLQQTQSELKMVREEIRKYEVEDSFCEMILQRHNSSVGVTGPRRISPPAVMGARKVMGQNQTMRRNVRKRGRGEKPAGRTPKDSAGNPMVWDEKGFWKSSSVPGEIKISNSKTTRSE